MPPFQTVRLCETVQAGAFATAAMAESQAIPSPPSPGIRRVLLGEGTRYGGSSWKHRPYVVPSGTLIY